MVVQLERYKPDAPTGKGLPTEPFRFRSKFQSETFPVDMLLVIQDALQQECLSGGSLGYPLTDIQATLLSAEYRDGESNEQSFRFAVADAVRTALEQAGTDVLEPIMKLEVVTPDDYIGEVTANLGARRAYIQEQFIRGRMRVIVAHVPLREMFGYSTVLRSLSQGRASYSMEPLDYNTAPPDVVKALM